MRTAELANQIDIADVDAEFQGGGRDQYAQLSCFQALFGVQALFLGQAAMVGGDLFLADVRAWREALCTRLGWRIETPLFGTDTAMLARAMIDGGLRTTLCCVDVEQLDADFNGRAFDAVLLAQLPAACDPCGENGEFHTLVHDGPMFHRSLALRRGDRVLRDGRFAYTDFLLDTAPA